MKSGIKRIVHIHKAKCKNCNKVRKFNFYWRDSPEDLNATVKCKCGSQMEWLEGFEEGEIMQ